MSTAYPYPPIDYRLPPDLVSPPEVRALADIPSNWGMATARVDALRKLSDGSGIKVGIVDTGAWTQHEQFRTGRVKKTRSFTNEPFGDGHSHGTHCAITVAGDDPRIGVSQGCELYVAKALTNSGSGRSDQIGAAFQWLADEGCHLITASIGGPSSDPWSEKALLDYTSRGGVAVIAGGNERQDGATLGFPAAYPFVMAVAAVDQGGRYAAFSNPGKNPGSIAISGPGVGIWSGVPGGGYQQKSGTSMACPFVAGCVALYLGAFLEARRPLPTCEAVRGVFRNWAVDAGRPGLDTDYGPGLIRCDMMAHTLLPEPPPVAA